MTTLATETWTGTTGAAWPAQWTSMAGNTIQANRGRQLPAGGYAAQAAFLSGMTAVADSDTVVTILPPTSGEWYATAAARASAITAASNAGFPSNGIAAQLGSGSAAGTTPNFIQVHRCSGGSNTQVNFTSISPTADAAGYKLRLAVQGSTYRVKVWGASSSEPTAWTVTYVDATPFLTAGKTWLGVQSGAAASAVTVDFDDLTVTDGVAAVVVGTATVGEVASGTSVTCNVPTGVVAGELLVAAVAHSEASAAVPDQAGWTTAAKVTTASAGVQTALFYRVATASEPASYTFTGLNATAANRATAEMVRLSGVDTVTPLDVTPGTAFATGTSVTTPSVTTVTAGALMIYTVARQTASAGDINAASGTTLLVDTTGTGRRTILASEARPTAGATGTRAWTATDATSLGMPGIAAAFRAALPKADTLTDDFTTADNAKWSGYDSNTTVVSGRLQQAVLSSYAAGLKSIAAYDLTGSSMHATLVQAPNVGNGSTEGYFRAEVDATNYVGWYVGDGNQLVAERKVAGTRTVVVSLTYSATTHRRLRIRESGGTVFFDTYDGSTWTQRASWVISGFAVTSVKPGFVAGYWGTEPSPGVVQWDDFNVAPPGAPVVVNPALSGSGTLTATVIPIKTVSASLTGSGTLSGTGTPKLTASPSLTGSGALTATTIHVATAALSGSGTLTADFGALAVNANLTGSGTLTASIFSIVVSQNLTGAGTLTATYGVVGAYNVALSGSGGLTAVATPKLSVACDLGGDGVLAAPSTSYRLFGWIFRTPTQEVWFHIAGRALVGKYDQGLTVYRVAGQWRTRLSPGTDELSLADRSYQGGYLHRLSDAEVADLTAGGFADNITYEEVMA